ncbi:MAG: hypothetical protein QXL16_02955 [Candidatus Micrarchaeaceae archaeon]
MKAKARDEITAIRKLMSKPNYAILKLLAMKSPRQTKEIYAELSKSFTRKTLILALRYLSLQANAIRPTHIRTEKGYDLGYAINPKVKEALKKIEEAEKIIESDMK